MSWLKWLEFAFTVLLVVGALALLWTRRYERREREAARRRREQRLVAWQHVDLPEAPQTLPEPGTKTLDPELASRLRESDEFEELRHFFGAYFHQDWDLDHETEDEVIRTYMEEHARLPQDVAELLREMDTLLAFGLSDVDLRNALDALGIEYRPVGDSSCWLRDWRTKVMTEAKGG